MRVQQGLCPMLLRPPSDRLESARKIVFSSVTSQHDDGNAIAHAAGLTLRTLLIALTKSSSWLSRRGFEVSQQPVEGLLIHAMRLPAPKVANITRIANQRWPARLQGHDRVVNLDRKEDGRALLTFSCQGGFDFLLDPLTRH